jgi:hypothetical protein
MREITRKGTELVGLNENRRRVGEYHPRCSLTDQEVDLIRELADPSDGSKPMSQREIAAKFEISRGTVGDIVSFRRRASYPTGWLRVKLTIGGRDVVHTVVDGQPTALQSLKPVRIDIDQADNDA